MTLTDRLSSHCTYVLSLHWTDRFRLHNAVMLLNYVLRSMRYLEQRTCIAAAEAAAAAAETTTSSAHSTVSATLSLHIRLHGSTASSVSMGMGIDMQSEEQQEEEDIVISSIPFDCMVFPSPAIGRRFLQYLVSTYYE